MFKWGSLEIDAMGMYIIFMIMLVLVVGLSIVFA
jgi:hypothetical protein